MILFLVAFAGGVLTVLSPCILPILPFVFSRADRPFLRNGLPMLVGMALTFAGVATLAAVAGDWIVGANIYGRWLAMLLMAFFALTLLMPALSERIMRPFVNLGGKIYESNSLNNGGNPDYELSSKKKTFVSSLVLGVATGLLWAPCAGPILGLVLTGAAIGGASVHTTLLLLAYAAGAATSLAAALLIGGRVFAAMKKSIGAGEWLRKGLGVSLLAGLVAIAFGLDTQVLAQVSFKSTARIEQLLADSVRESAKALRVQSKPTDQPASSGSDMNVDASTASMTGFDRSGMIKVATTMTPVAAPMPPLNLPVEDLTPSFAGAVEWINSPPLTLESLKGKVVLVDIWTFGCINCIHALPYVRGWAEKYKDKGLVVVGVHSPEFPFEKNIGNVRNATKDLKITFPVAVDNNFAIWKSFNNEYWPAHYFIDAKGRIRFHHFGEGEYEKSEQVIQQLLAEAAKS